jgi:c-di-GMP-related signal transduction protein
VTADLYVARQPILDGDHQLFGYELLFRSGPDNFFFPGTDPDQSSMENIEKSISGFGLDTLIGDRWAFVNVGRRVLVEDRYALLPPTQTVIEVLETVEPDDEVVAACQRLKGRGYTLALDDFVSAPKWEPLLALADIVKIEFRDGEPVVGSKEARRLRRLGLTLLAEKVETEADANRAAESGFSYFQGFYFCRPQMMQTGDPQPDKLDLLGFLSEIHREDVSFEKLENLLRMEATLSARLLRYLNSAGFGWRYEVTSIHQAIRLLGLRPLRKWASLVAVRSMAESKTDELLVTALVRAHFAERLGNLAGLPNSDLEPFLVGLLSLMDAIMDRPLPGILGQLAFSDPIRSALLRHAGDWGLVLTLVEAFERADWERVSQVAETLSLPYERLPAHYAASVQQADQTVHDRPAAA